MLSNNTRRRFFLRSLAVVTLIFSQSTLMGAIPGFAQQTLQAPRMESPSINGALKKPHKLIRKPAPSQINAIASVTPSSSNPDKNIPIASVSDHTAKEQTTLTTVDGVTLISPLI